MMNQRLVARTGISAPVGNLKDAPVAKDIKHLLCRLCSPGGNRSPEIGGPLAGILLEAVHRHGLAPRIYSLHGASGNLPDDLRERFRWAALESEALELQRRPALAELLDALAERQIPALLMKGAALAYTLYPSPGMRPRSDTDILIPESAAAPARALLEVLGFNLPGLSGPTTLSAQFAATRQLPGGTLDLVDIHHRLSNRATFARLFTFEELDARSQPVSAVGASARGLGPVDALLLACLHRVGHLNEGDEDRLIWLYDIHLLLENLTSEEIRLFTGLAREKGLLSICKDGIEKARACFATRIPEEIQAVIEKPPRNEPAAALLRAGPVATLWLQFKAQASWRAHVQLVKDLVFPSRQYMRRKYPNSKAWLPLLYVRRSIEGLMKRLRRRR